LWERNNRPGSFKKIKKIYTIDSFIKYRLTGESNINHSQGAYYGVAYDIRSNIFDQKILDVLDIEKDLIPEVTDSEEIIGYVTERAASKTGLFAGTPIASGQALLNPIMVFIFPVSFEIDLNKFNPLFLFKIRIYHAEG